MPDSGGRTFELGDDQASRCEQTGRSPQHAHRISANPNVPVREQDLVPVALSRQWREEIRSHRCPAAPSRQVDGSARRINPQGRVPSVV
jgi:hypothetical protein